MRVQPAAIPPVLAGDVGMFTLIARWQSFLEVSGRANANTRRQYRRLLLGFLADTMIDARAITEDDLVRWAAEIDRHGETFGMTIRALRSFARFAVDRGEMLEDPTRHMRIPKRRRKPPRKTSDADLERLFSAAELIDPRARPTLELAFATGARVGSLAAVMPEDVDLDQDLIFFRVAKNDDPYQVPLGARAHRAALELLALGDYRPPRATRRPTLIGVGESRIYQWCHDAGERAGLHFWTHRLRHEFLHRVANDPKIPPLVAAGLANHKDTRLLLVYADPDEALKRAAVGSL